MSVDARVRLSMLGDLRVTGPRGASAQFEMRRSALLLAYLALHGGRRFPREALAEVLWPDEDPEVTGVRFRQVLAGLRRGIESAGISPAELLLSDGGTIGLCAMALTTDVAEFDAWLAAARRCADARAAAEALRQATDLYAGDLLPGCYDEWLSLERNRLAGACAEALTRLAETRLELGETAAAVEAARAAVRMDPLREQAHAALIRGSVAAGCRSDALRQLRELERMLREEYGTTPDPALRALLRGDSDPGPSGYPPSPRERAELEPIGGAVPLASPYYVTRPADEEFAAAIRRRDSIVLVKGPRQVGKTSLLARGLAAGRVAGARVVLTDFQKLPAPDLADADSLFHALGLSWSEQLALDVPLERTWRAERSWAANWEGFVRRDVLRAGHRPLIWALDEVDRLFHLPYGSEVFGLFRSWHNERSLDPESPWGDLTLAISYATEAHLFITDLNQSPFNVGTRVTLGDFTPGEVAELDRRHGGLLDTPSALEAFIGLFGGHPYLVRRGLFELAAGPTELDALRTRAPAEDGPFGDHLRRLRAILTDQPELRAAVTALARDGTPPHPDTYYRLRSAGLIGGESAGRARLRCGLYATYLAGLAD